LCFVPQLNWGGGGDEGGGEVAATATEVPVATMILFAAAAAAADVFRSLQLFMVLAMGGMIPLWVQHFVDSRGNTGHYQSRRSGHSSW
jgi:hypothetical protein